MFSLLEQLFKPLEPTVRLCIGVHSRSVLFGSVDLIFTPMFRMQEDVGLVGNDYTVATTVFTVGFVHSILFELTSITAPNQIYRGTDTP